MIILNGKYNEAKVFTDNIEKSAREQIVELLNQEFMKGENIRIMSDVHAGAGCTIGFTSTITNKVVPNLIGVDIGCGLLMAKLSKRIENLDELDSIIRHNIPSGFNVHERPAFRVGDSLKEYISTLNCLKPANINMDRALCSLGTLGGGNHFIELDEDDDGNQYLVVHTGSRYLGKQIATYYQELAYEQLTDISNEKDKIIKSLIEQGRQREIQSELKKLEKPKINKNLAYLEGDLFWEYLDDMHMAQNYADFNRTFIINSILLSLGIDGIYRISTAHNYIDESFIVRKGAVYAGRGTELLIPINVRDGILICEGKGNPDWNYSAPHGAGRICSRGKAREQFSMDEFKSEMDGIYSTCISENTLDESPMAYKPMDEIIKNIGDTVEIKKVIKPIYNFKAN